LQEWIDQRRISSDTLLWREGMEQWDAASAVFPDMFRTSLPASHATAAGPSSVPAASAPASTSTAGTVSGTGTVSAALAAPGNSDEARKLPTSHDGATRLARQRRLKRKRQMMLVTTLMIIALILTLILVWIIMNPSASPNPPSG
jgi:hypothetical protein